MALKTKMLSTTHTKLVEKNLNSILKEWKLTYYYFYHINININSPTTVQTNVGYIVQTVQTQVHR